MDFRALPRPFRATRKSLINNNVLPRPSAPFRAIQKPLKYKVIPRSSAPSANPPIPPYGAGHPLEGDACPLKAFNRRKNYPMANERVETAGGIVRLRRKPDPVVELPDDTVDDLWRDQTDVPLKDDAT